MSDWLTDSPVRIQEIPWTYPVHTLNIPWTYPEHTLNIPWTYPYHTLIIPWTYPVPTLEIVWRYAQDLINSQKHYPLSTMDLRDASASKNIVKLTTGLTVEWFCQSMCLNMYKTILSFLKWLMNPYSRCFLYPRGTTCLSMSWTRELVSCFTLSPLPRYVFTFTLADL